MTFIRAQTKLIGRSVAAQLQMLDLDRRSRIAQIIDRNRIIPVIGRISPGSVGVDDDPADETALSEESRLGDVALV